VGSHAGGSGAGGGNAAGVGSEVGGSAGGSAGAVAASGAEAVAGASGGGSSGGSSAGRLRGRPPAFLEGPPLSTLLFFALFIVTPLCLTIAAVRATAEHLPGEGAQGCTMSVLKQLAKRLGQLFPAPHPRQRRGERRRWFRRGSSAHLLDTFCSS